MAIAANSVTLRGLSIALAGPIFVAIGIGILDVWAVVNFPGSIFGVSSIYVGASMISIVALSGRYSLVSGLYVGLLIAAFCTGRFTPFTPLLNLCNIVGAIPLILSSESIKKAGLNSKAGAVYFWVLAGPVQSALSALWFFVGISAISQIDEGVLWSGIWAWVGGGIFVATALTLPLVLSASIWRR